MKNQIIEVNQYQTTKDIITKLESLGYTRDKDDLELNLSFEPDCICAYGVQGTYTLHRHLAVGFGGRTTATLDCVE